MTPIQIGIVGCLCLLLLLTASLPVAFAMAVVGFVGFAVVVSPDVGGVARARDLAKRINAPLAIVDKRREKAGEVSEMTVIGDVSGKKCIIVDDICDTAGTLCKAAETLIEAGATEVHSYITHGVLSGPAVERVQNSVMKSLVITDSIEQGAKVKGAKNIRIVPKHHRLDV